MSVCCHFSLPVWPRSRSLCSLCPPPLLALIFDTDATPVLRPVCAPSKQKAHLGNIANRQSEKSHLTQGNRKNNSGVVFLSLFNFRVCLPIKEVNWTQSQTAKNQKILLKRKAKKIITTYIKPSLRSSKLKFCGFLNVLRQFSAEIISEKWDPDRTDLEPAEECLDAECGLFLCPDEWPGEGLPRMCLVPLPHEGNLVQLRVVSAFLVSM